MTLNQYARVVLQLIKVDLFAYTASRYLNELIDSFFWTAVTLLVSGKLLSTFGMKAGFGIFVAAGIPTTRCLFQVYPRATATIIDLMSNKAITYELTLPIPTWLVFVRIICSSFIRNLLLSVPALPFCLLLTWDEFQPAVFCASKFAIILCLSALCCSTLGLVLASIVTDCEQLSSAWNRILSPMWMLGCFQFSWTNIALKMPWLGYFILANPITYAMEGTRVAILGQPGFLPFWNCVGALIMFSLAFGYIGVTNMQKRLDCV